MPKCIAVMFEWEYRVPNSHVYCLVSIIHKHNPMYMMLKVWLEFCTIWLLFFGFVRFEQFAVICTNFLVKWDFICDDNELVHTFNGIAISFSPFSFVSIGIVLRQLTISYDYWIWLRTKNKVTTKKKNQSFVSFSNSFYIQLVGAWRDRSVINRPIYWLLWIQ